ncbi:hypothetical protein GALMADRAFT_249629 [Galerina marginata CBS 339.88]|uniref:DUF6534 domain-containing protein n=1 Tax=Galerina marginata (strain CBS 339.88) TaxID=685588 RepID=A0A067SXE6_GALM3|nr:hypothetical protein GALMADRAFT_249629 [Galerina marginata CBS 339.88]
MSTGQLSAQQGPSIEGLTPFLIATTVCAPLWGVMVSQAAAYYRTYQNDNKYLKILVGISVVLCTAQLATLSYTVYFWMIVCRAPKNYEFLGSLGNALVVVPAYITYFLATLVQCFYAMRVWFVSRKKLWLVSAIVILSITQFVGGFALVSYFTTVNNIDAAYLKFSHISGSIELGSSIACDILISGSLWWYLRKGRGNVFRSTRGAIDALIHQAVNIGLLTNIIALVNLTTWLSLPQSDFTWAVFHFAVGKVYVNSMLVSLNTREKIRHNMGSTDGSAYLASSTFDIDGTTRHDRSDFEMGTRMKNQRQFNLQEALPKKEGIDSASAVDEP